MTVQRAQRKTNLVRPITQQPLKEGSFRFQTGAGVRTHLVRLARAFDLEMYGTVFRHQPAGYQEINVRTGDADSAPSVEFTTTYHTHPNLNHDYSLRDLISFLLNEHAEEMIIASGKGLTILRKPRRFLSYYRTLGRYIRSMRHFAIHNHWQELFCIWVNKGDPSRTAADLPNSPEELSTEDHKAYLLALDYFTLTCLMVLSQTTERDELVQALGLEREEYKGPYVPSTQQSGQPRFATIFERFIAISESSSVENWVAEIIGRIQEEVEV